MARFIITIVAIMALGSSVLSASAPQVQTSAGTLQGGVCESDLTVTYYKSVPYAKPPIGDLRYAPPQAYSQKYPNGILEATSPAPACIQFGNEFVENSTTSEDCLYLNIWMPATAKNGSDLPVRVWLYGGANQAGAASNPQYDGCNVAGTNAIVVNVNYRLGPLGFLALASAGIDGNQGTQDQLLALQWVQDNIASFGGDPQKVVLHGQSAGAIDTFTIATLPQAPTLFKSAIMESGGGRDIAINDTAQAVGQGFAQGLNCSATDASCLRNVSITDIENVYNSMKLLNSYSLAALTVGGLGYYMFSQYVDGKVIPEQPSQAGVKVPSIFGATELEGTLFALLQYATSPKGPASATAADYQTFLQQNFGSAASLIEEYYPVSAFASGPTAQYPAFYAMAVVLGYAGFVCPAYRGLNTAVANGIPTWTYRFSHTLECAWFNGLPQSAIPLIGPTHTAEIPFVFGQTTDLPRGSNSTCNMTQAEVEISDFLVKSWTLMAVNGQPTLSSDTDLWPEYGGANSSRGININETVSVGYVNYTACALWDQVAEILEAAAYNSSNATSTTSTGAAATATSTAASAARPRSSLEVFLTLSILSVAAYVFGTF